MSETHQDLNAYTRRDSELAQHVANAEEPFRVGTEQARNLGEVATATALDNMQRQAGDEAYRNYAANHGDELGDSPGIAGQSPNYPEVAGMDKEKVGEWLREGAVSLHTWMAGQGGIDPGHKESGGTTGFNTFFNERDRVVGIKGRFNSLPNVVRDSFAEENIAELVTICPEEYKFSKVDNTSEYADEEAVSIVYQTLSTGYKTKFQARAAGNGARGNTVTMHVVLPRTKADQMMQMAKRNPELLHELADGLMLDRVQAGQDWKDTRPPYEEWRALNDGISKIAFRNSVITPLEDSEVIEY